MSSKYVGPNDYYQQTKHSRNQVHDDSRNSPRYRHSNPIPDSIDKLKLKLANPDIFERPLPASLKGNFSK